MERHDKTRQDRSDPANIIGQIPESILWYNFSINIIVLVIACLIIFYFPYKQILSIKVYTEGISSNYQDFSSDSYCINIKLMEELKDAIHINDKVILKSVSGKEYIGQIKNELDVYREEVLVQFETSKDKPPITEGKYDGKIVISDLTIWKMLILLNERIFNQ